MALSDEQIVLKALEVAERRGWSFIMETMLTSSSSTKRARGLWGQQSDGNSVMASQESEEDDEDCVQDTVPPEQRVERPSWRQLVTHQQETISFSKVIPMLGKGEDVRLRIKLFIDKTTRTFNDCFFSDKVDSDLSATNSTSSTAESSVHVQTQTPQWDTCPTPAAQIEEKPCANVHTQTPAWDKRSTVVGKHPGPATKRPSSTRSIAVSVVHVQTQTLAEQAVPTHESDHPQGTKSKVGTLEREPVPWLKPKVFRSTFPLVAVARHLHPSEDFPWSLPLAAHVSKQLKTAVVTLRFFDMFLLLPDGNTDLNLPEQPRTFERWQSAFAIMGSILMDNAPEKLLGIFNYCETIRKAHEHLPEGAWLEYDAQFRQLKEVEPYISWAVIHPQLWPHIVKPASLSEEEARDTMYDRDPSNSFQLGICANCGGEHLEEMCPDLDPDAEQHELPVPLGVPRKEADYCFSFNTDRCDKGQQCNFNHLCSNCDGTHPEFACPRLVPNIEDELGLAEPDFEPHRSPLKKVKTGYCFLYNEDQCMKGSDCFLCHVCANCGGEHPKLRCPILNSDAEFSGMAYSDPLKRSPKKVKTGYCFLYNEDQCLKGKDCFLSHVCADCGGDHPKLRCPQINPDYAEYDLEPRMWPMKASHRDDLSGIKRPRLISGRSVDELSYMESNVGFTEQAHRIDDPPSLNWSHLNPDRDVRKQPFMEPRVYSTRAGNSIDEDSLLNWRHWNPDREVHKRPYLEPNVGFREQAIGRDELQLEMWRKRNPERDVPNLPYMDSNVGFPEQAIRRDDPPIGNWPHLNPDRGMHQPPFTEPRVPSTYQSNRRDEPLMEKWPQLNPDKEIDNLDPQGASMKKAKTGYCFRYNKNECTDGENCSFNHVCSKCSGEHPKVKCPQLSEGREVARQGSVWEEIKESVQSQFDVGMQDTGNRFSTVCLLCGESHPNEKCPRWHHASESKKHPDYATAVQDRMLLPLEEQNPLYTAFE